VFVVLYNLWITDKAYQTAIDILIFIENTCEPSGLEHKSLKYKIKCINI
jgi:hypothetical protein